MSKNNELIIFCQAGADVIYTLDLIEKNNESNILIYVCNVKSIYDFLKSLNLRCRLFFLERINLSLYSLKSLLKAKNKINEYVDKYLEYKGATVYFFSTSYDFLTATIVRVLSYNNNVIYYNHYDHLTWLRGEYNFSLKRKIASLLYYFISGTKFSSQKSVNFPKFKYELYSITKKDVKKKPNINSKYLVKPKTDSKSLLLFFAPYELSYLSLQGQDVFFNLLNDIKSSYTVFLKGHPRLGAPEELLKFVDKRLDDFLPSEFIDYSRFDFVIGLTSAALCYPASKKMSKVLSLLEFLDLKDKKRKEELKKYINSYSNDSISYDVNQLINE